MVKRYRCVIMATLLVLILGIGGCGSKREVAAPSVAQPGTTPTPEEPAGELNDPSASTEHVKVAAFKGTDFLTGEEVEFKPGESSRPAIISFFSPG